MSRSNFGVVSQVTNDNPSRERGERKGRLLGFIALCFALSGSAAGCAAQGDPGGDSSTNFWRECNNDEQCGDTLQCLCGRCSSACNRAADCPAKAAVCVNAEAELSCALPGNVCAIDELESDAGAQSGAATNASSAPTSDATTSDASGNASATSPEPSTTLDGPMDGAVDAGTNTDSLGGSDPSAEISSAESSSAESSGEAGPEAAAGWAQVQSVDNSSGAAFSPAVAIDADGNAVAVWSSSWDDGHHSISAKHYSAKEGWDEETTVATSSTLLTGICLAGNPDGAAVASWVALGDTSSQLWVATLSPAAGWSTATAVGPESPTVNAADCALDAAGNAALVFSHHDGNKSLLHAVRFAPAAGWGEPERLDQTDFNVGAYSLAFDGDGNALVLWNAWLGDQSELWSSRYVVTEGWQEAVPFATTAEMDQQSVDVALNGLGEGIGVWTEQAHDGSQSAAWAASFTADGNWAEPQSLQTGSDALSGLAVGLTDSSVALVVWEALTQGEAARQNRIFTRRRANALWSAPETLAEDAAHVSLAVSRRGPAVAVWRTPLDYMIDGDIAGAVFEEGTGFGASTVFAEGSAGDSVGAWASINDEGRARVVWQHDVDQLGDIVSNELR